MSGSTIKRAAQVVAENVTDGVDEAADAAAEIGSSVIGDDGVEKVIVAKDWLVEIEARLAKAERPVLVKAKDAVLANRRKLALAGTTVLALGAAAYVVTHRDEVFEGLEQATEATAETVELGAQAVKKDARKARTGSTTK